MSLTMSKVDKSDDVLLIYQKPFIKEELNKCRN